MTGEMLYKLLSDFKDQALDNDKFLFEILSEYGFDNDALSEAAEQIARSIPPFVTDAVVLIGGMDLGWRLHEYLNSVPAENG